MIKFIWNGSLKSILNTVSISHMVFGESTVVILCTLDYSDNSLLMRHLPLSHSTERCSISLTSKANVKCIELCCLLICSRYRKCHSYSVVPQSFFPKHSLTSEIRFYFKLSQSNNCSLFFLIYRVVAFVLMGAVVIDR